MKSCRKFWEYHFSRKRSEQNWKTQNKENNKKEKNQEICVRRVTYDDSSKDISFFCTTGVLKASIAIILR